MAESYREHSCPNCGAPLGIPARHERFFKCQFCGTVLEDQASEEEQETGIFKIQISEEAISTARAERVPTYSAPPKEPTQVKNRFGCLLAAAIFLLVGGILAVSLVPALITTGAISSNEGLSPLLEDVGLAPLSDNSGLGNIQLYAYGPTNLLQSDNDTTADFIGAALGAENRSYVTYVDFENDPALRWVTEVFGEQPSYVYNQFLADDTRVYFSMKGLIMAFNRSQGTVLWEAALSDEIQHNICPGCFQLFGDHLVTLAADGTLQTWDIETGSLIWEIELTATPRQVINFGGNPAVLDETNESTGLKIFNIPDGETLETLYPTCRSEPFPNNPQEIGIYNYMLPVGRGAGVVFFGGFFEPGCAIYWRPGEQTPTWITEFSSDIVSNLDPENILLENNTIFLSKGAGVHKIDMLSGVFQTLVEDEDYRFYPLAAQDDVLTVRAERTRGTRSWEIWGIDTQIGNIKWMYEPDAESFTEPLAYAGPVSEDGIWSAEITSEGLTVLQVFDKTPRLILQTISLQSGTVSNPITLNLDEKIGSFQLSILGWKNNLLWTVESVARLGISVFDVETGEIINAWP